MEAPGHVPSVPSPKSGTGSETKQFVRVGAGGTVEKTGRGDGGGRIEDVTVFVGSDKNWTISGMRTSKGQRSCDGLERKHERQD